MRRFNPYGTVARGFDRLITRRKSEDHSGSTQKDMLGEISYGHLYERRESVSLPDSKCTVGGGDDATERNQTMNGMNVCSGPVGISQHGASDPGMVGQRRIENNPTLTMHDRLCQIADDLCHRADTTEKTAICLVEKIGRLVGQSIAVPEVASTQTGNECACAMDRIDQASNRISRSLDIIAICNDKL